MESKDIFNKIENIIYTEIEKSEVTKKEKGTGSENNLDKNSFKEIVSLMIRGLINFVKAPFNTVAKYLKNEIIQAVKKDAKLYVLIFGLICVLFLCFSVIWLSFFVAIGAYFYELGHSILISTIYSIVFQVVGFVLISIIALIASKKLTSFKMLKKISNNVINEK